MIAELVRQARDGDAEAYTELVCKFQDAVFATAYQMVLDFDTARDLAQETFVRAYERLGSLRDPASFPGWVIRICRNLALSWLREPEREWVALDPAEVFAGDLAESVAIRDLVSRALSTLPEDNRLALSLFLVDGYTYREVAELTDVPLSTARGRIERARHKLATEVLAMTEETLKGSAPDEKFTLETVRKSLEKAGEALEDREGGTARSVAEEALEKLSELEGDEAERRKLRLKALSVVQRSAFFADHDRWCEATREAIRVCEDRGDAKAISGHLYGLALHDGKLTRTEKDALVVRCLELFEQTGQAVMLGQALFFYGWHHIDRGQFKAGFDLLDRGRDAMQDEPYNVWHACLDATDEFRRLTDEQLDKERIVAWGGTCDVAQVEGERLIHHGQPGFSCHSGKQEEMAKFAGGFSLFWWTGWLPYTGPGAGYEEEKSTFSYTGNPTHTRTWVEADDVSVNTPAGEFPDCLLVRGMVTPSPRDADGDAQRPERNKIWCGEKYCWLARGVGPVAYRAEREDGIVEHAVLSKFECPEHRDEWVPLVVGTRWEYVPAEPAEDFDALVVMRLTHVDGEGKYYLARTSVGNRRDE